MSIKNVRLNEILDNIIYNAVKEGYLPSSRYVVFKATDYMFNHDISRPYYEFKHINKKDITDSTEYNSRLDKIYDDLSILYSRLSYSNNTFKEQTVDMAIKKRKLLEDIKGLKDEIDVLIAKFNNKGITEVFFDTLRNSSKVDASNTTALIDKGASIKPLVTNSRRLDSIPSMSLKVLGDDTTVLKNGDYKAVYNNDDNNTSWSAVITSVDEGPVGIKLTLDFSSYRTPLYSSKPNLNGVLLNRIAIDASQSNIKLEYTYDKENIYEIPYTNGIQPLKNLYVFPEILATEVYITFIKDKSDSINSSNLFEYIFNLKNLSCYSYDYYDGGTLQSIEFKSDHNINKISLSVDEETPETSSIDYFIGIDDEWMPISSLEDNNPKYSQVIDLMNVEPAASQRYSVSSAQSRANQALNDLRYNGITFYKLGDIKHSVISSSLYRGRNAIKTSDGYSIINSTKPSTLYSGQATDIEFYVFSTQDISFTSIPASDMSCSIRLNNSVIFNTGSLNQQLKLTFHIVKGWNKFNISLLGDGSFDIGYNLTAIGSIYAENKPMEKVDFFDLQRTVKINDHDKYAIYNNAVVVNDYIPDIEYELIYDYVSSETKSIKFKAVLNRNQSHITPILKSYYIQII